MTYQVKRPLLLILFLVLSSNTHAEDCVVLLHGLASNQLVMKPLEMAIDLQPELRTINESYNSYSGGISEIANKEIPQIIEKCALKENEHIHFVTHSMGGLLLRAYLDDQKLNDQSIPQLGQIVMIAPPNNGSEIVDLLHEYGWLANILGPAGKQLTTDETAFTQQLQDQDTPLNLGVIAGVQNSFIFSRFLPEGDDGKVSTESAQLPNMTDFITVEASHSGLLIQKETIEQTLSFLRYRKFGVTQVPELAAE